ncbi:FxDxF family PEP-CTERM protein [Sphingomonas phyllosphaerae]|uniref:FxDxF family PEP-CTERM protein n=1 Tax=Sphingomonas phyllosphaerae TaxID=257003 RepID=UPI0009DC12FC|nr:FxDxF family PEP-CTERM protein [Sphingomonas phyllosphaerae]
MKNFVMSALAAAALLGASSAGATTFPVGSPNFTATAGPNGSFAGSFRNVGIVAGLFTDYFTFTLPLNGQGSGTVTTSVNMDDLFTANDLDFTSVLVNGIAANLTVTSGGAFEVAFAQGIPITANKLNTIEVNGVSRGNGAYGGQATFSPTAAVPETATWALMIVGFGVMGYSLRRRQTGSRIRQAI